VAGEVFVDHYSRHAGLGYVTKYSGTDATLGLALAKTGVFYPFFGTMLGWLGVALTGSDTASNVLFGSLQTITAKQTHVDPVLMAAANSSGGVMGKMVDRTKHCCCQHRYELVWT
jgi:lactate permease